MYTFVASLESLLTASAVDKLDPWKRQSNMNKEFIGKGIANSVASLLGGLPMIAEVVRSAANIQMVLELSGQIFSMGYSY